MVAASSAAVMAALVVPGVLPALCVFGGLPVLGVYALWWTLRDRVGGTSGALRDLAGVAGITVVALILADRSTASGCLSRRGSMPRD